MGLDVLIGERRRERPSTPYFKFVRQNLAQLPVALLIALETARVLYHRGAGARCLAEARKHRSRGGGRTRNTVAESKGGSLSVDKREVLRHSGRTLRAVAISRERLSRGKKETEQQHSCVFVARLQTCH